MTVKLNIPEHFIWNDKFCSDLDSIFFYLTDEYGELDNDFSQVPDDWKDEIIECDKEKVITLDADYIMERVDDERFDEEDVISGMLYEALKKIDWDSINKTLPYAYYPNRNKIIITKQDLIDYAS